MKLLINILTRWILYIMIALPLLRSIIGTGWFGSLVSFVLMLVLAGALEVTGTMRKIVAKILGLLGRNEDGSSRTGPVGGGGGPVPLLQDGAECPNCGMQVQLSLGSGKCEGCGTIVTKN